MYVDDIEHYLSHGMLCTKDGQKVTSATQSEADTWSIGLADGTRGLINADDLRIYMRTFFTTIEGELIAMFPFEADDFNPDHCMSYMHVGQHSGAYFAYWSAAWRNKKPLDPVEVAKLTKELESIGYYVEVLPRPMPRGLKMSAAHARRKQIDNLFKKR
jgi:hypothetical protein